MSPTNSRPMHAPWTAEIRRLNVRSTQLGARWVAVAVIAVIACNAEVTQTEPPAVSTPAEVPFVGRQLAMAVSNQSDRPARLIVGGEGDLGRPLGIALPPVVQPHRRQEVVFTVPDTNNWAIWVNAGEGGGELISWREVRRCVGRVPIEINIAAGGGVSWGQPGASCVTPP